MKNSKGITLVGIAVTIVILLIIASVTITRIAISKKDVSDNVLESELQTLQTAIGMQYQKYTTVKDKELLIGEICTEDNLRKNNIEMSSEEISKYQADEYYKILGNSDLKKLGMKRAKDIFIVNYKTGETINLTSTKSDGTVLRLEGISK